MNRVVLIEGARTPFLRSGTQFADIKGYELLRHALISVVSRASIPKDTVEYVAAGFTMQNVTNSNVARDAVMAAGFNAFRTPAHSMTMACISANQAITTVANLISNGDIHCGIAGGVDSLSDPPIRITRELRKWFLKMNKTKTFTQKLGLALKLKPSMFLKFDDMIPYPEFTTNETMGNSCDRMTKHFNVSRKEQDEFAVRSHSLAGKASKDGHFIDINPIFIPNIGLIERDNGIRKVTLESASSYRPAFAPDGTATAINSSFFTDGASVTLLMSESLAIKLSLKPKVVIKDYCYVAVDPSDHLLLGPAFATSLLLKRNRLALKDFDVFEFHEAFAGQVLANLKVMDCEKYSREKIGCDKVGCVPIDKLNTWGGSVSLGHPFGATGSRLMNMATNRLIETNGRLALIASCARGGLGHAMIIERF